MQEVWGSDQARRQFDGTAPMRLLMQRSWKSKGKLRESLLRRMGRPLAPTKQKKKQGRMMHRNHPHQNGRMKSRKRKLVAWNTILTTPEPEQTTTAAVAFETTETHMVLLMEVVKSNLWRALACWCPLV